VVAKPTVIRLQEDEPEVDESESVDGDLSEDDSNDENEDADEISLVQTERNKWEVEDSEIDRNLDE
jgi:hypothetical protein